MTQQEHDLIDAFLGDRLEARDHGELQGLLRRDADARRLLRDLATVDVKLEQLASATAASLDSVPREPASEAKASRRIAWLSWRPLAAAAAGLVIGLFCATVAWGMVSPRAVATAERLLTLDDGSFEGGAVAAGFPKGTGVWSGDAAEVVLAEGMRAAEGRRTLRFVKAEGDASDPESRAIACDIFQLVDLRPLRASLATGGDSVLELSASFLDARAADSKPSVTFFCQIFLFRGEAENLHQRWPQCIPEAIGSGSAQLTTFGGGGDSWGRLTAKSLVSTEADFAVIQISARPNLRVPMPPLLFADAVELTLKTQPNLPVRLVHR